MTGPSDPIAPRPNPSANPQSLPASPPSGGPGQSPTRTYFVGPWELSHATACLPEGPRDGRILLIESAGYLSALPHHRKKVALLLSAMRHFRDELRAEGFHVDYRTAPTYAEGIAAHVAEYRPAEVIVQEPAEWDVARSIAALGDVQPGGPPTMPLGRTRLTIVPDRRFLVPRAEFGRWAKGRKVLRMEDFYRWQRRWLAVLVDRNGDPVGGRWSFDRKHREPARALARHGLPPQPIALPPDEITRAAMAAADALPDLWGDTTGFDLPVTRAQALTALDDFLDHRLVDFAAFDDAMLRGQGCLHHSRLSAALNVGLLHPAEVVRAAVARWEGNATADAPGVMPLHRWGGVRGQPGPKSTAPLDSVEAFVRRIIGWREYANGIYWLTMPDYRRRNYFGFRRAVPRLYWDGETDLACLADSVRMARETGHAHHIHRLMVLANFANLTGVHPLRLGEWFWAAFIDGVEWAALPNAIGLGGFGDGGLLAIKPYVSSAAYINRMSDYCAGCRYDPAQRVGDDACPFNYLYWTFLDDVRRRELNVGRRMVLMLKQLERIPAAELRAMRKARERFLAGLAPDAADRAVRHDGG